MILFVNNSLRVLKNRQEHDKVFNFDFTFTFPIFLSTIDERNKERIDNYEEG